VDGLAEALRTAVIDPHAVATSAARRAQAASFTWRTCAELTVGAYRLASGRH
jgi:hypothetical protein